MKLTLGFSPCPNDTFIFDALVNKKIDTADLDFDVILEDVETLNKWALEKRLDVTKLSFPAFFKSLGNYILLSAGSALGKGVGPLLISKPAVRNSKFETQNLEADIENSIIALPGKNTTANLLFSFAYPLAKNKIFMRFNEIEDFVLHSAVFAEEVEKERRHLGVIIHENRFTYQLKGLDKLMDLGAYWEQMMQIPIPLGGIAVNRSIENSIGRQINNLITQSVEYAFANYPGISSYVKDHSQEMNENVMRRHIELYVNNYSIDLGNEGKNAIKVLYEVFLSTQEDEKNSLHQVICSFCKELAIILPR